MTRKTEQLIARLEAWRDTADMLARRLPDAEAEPHRNMSANYGALIDLARGIAVAE